MKKLNELSKKIYISGQRKTQLGNSLVPVIIALAISAVASVAFLDQGSILASKNKAHSAQFEIIELLDQWKSLKSWKKTSQITPMEFPSSDYRINIYGAQTSYSTNFFSSTNRKALSYEGITGGLITCQRIANEFLNYKGVSRRPIIFGGTAVPTCVPAPNDTFVIVLPLE